jgi:hypothetical protein
MRESSEAQAIQRLESELAIEREEPARLQTELDLRNCALDSANSHFMIVTPAALGGRSFTAVGEAGCFGADAAQ